MYRAFLDEGGQQNSQETLAASVLNSQLVKSMDTLDVLPAEIFFDQERRCVSSNTYRFEPRKRNRDVNELAFRNVARFFTMEDKVRDRLCMMICPLR